MTTSLIPKERFNAPTEETLLRFVDERAKQPLYDLRAVGSMTSKSPCYQTTGTTSLSALDYIEMVGEHRVRAGAGVVLKSLIDFLNERQLALPTIGEWSGQTLEAPSQLEPTEARIDTARYAPLSIVSRCSTEPANCVPSTTGTQLFPTFFRLSARRASFWNLNSTSSRRLALPSGDAA